MTRVYYKTTAAVKNPTGDPRSNRAHWRDPLDKSVIEPGFLWFHDERGHSVHSMRSNSYRYVTSEEGLQLLNDLKANSVVVEETFGAVVREFGWAEHVVLRIVLDEKGITPAELRAMLARWNDRDVPGLNAPPAGTGR